MSDEVYGLLARFDDTDALKKAIRAAGEEGYTHVDAYLPYPDEEVAEALGSTDRRVSVIALISAIVAAASILLLQVVSSMDYPFNTGGKPVVSWPAFGVVTFVVGMLGATVGSLVAMLAITGLPKPYHPLFNVEDFDRASRDGLFLCIEASDPHFDETATREFLRTVNAAHVAEVPS